MFTALTDCPPWEGGFGKAGRGQRRWLEAVLKPPSKAGAEHDPLCLAQQLRLQLALPHVIPSLEPPEPRPPRACIPRRTAVAWSPCGVGVCCRPPEGRDQLGGGVRTAREGSGERGHWGGGATRETVAESSHVVWRPSRGVGVARGRAGLGHVTWEEVGGALDGVRGGGESVASGRAPRPVPLGRHPWTPAFLPPASRTGAVRPALARRRAVCAGAAGRVAQLGGRWSRRTRGRDHGGRRGGGRRRRRDEGDLPPG